MFETSLLAQSAGVMGGGGPGKSDIEWHKHLAVEYLKVPFLELYYNRAQDHITYIYIYICSNYSELSTIMWRLF